MVLDHILLRLQSPIPDHRRAVELARLGFIEWLGSLPGDSDFNRQALAAYERAAPLSRTTPAIAELCDLLLEAMRVPLRPLDLAFPRPCRRGGARGRRVLH